MEKLTLTIDPEYASWGLWEAVREIIQNYLDARTSGVAFTSSSIAYDPATKTLTLTNWGVVMNRRSLILGNTDKRDDTSMRGQWGEGMKIAWATFIRLGRHVEVVTGAEVWTPRIATSTDFDGASVLEIAVHTKVDPINAVIVEVARISPLEWEMIQSRVLELQTAGLGGTINGEGGRLLLDGQFAGKLFVKGIYVCDMPGKWEWGYDLDNVELDRDRKIPSSISLDPIICTLLKDLTVKKLITVEAIVSMLADDSFKDGELFADWWNDQNPGEFHTQVAAAFKAEHGETAVPVSSGAEAIDAESHGMRAVIVPKALRMVVEKKEGDLATRIGSQPPVTVEDGPRSSFTTAEICALEMAWTVVQDKVPWLGENDLRVVAFVNSKKLGDYRDGKIRVARRLLETMGMLIVVIAHEAACRDAREGTTAHRDIKDGIIAHVLESSISAT